MPFRPARTSVLWRRDIAVEARSCPRARGSAAQIGAHRGGRCVGRVVPGRPRVAVVTTGSSSRARIDAGPGRDLRVERRDARGAAGCRRSEVGMPRSVADDEERTAARSSKASRSTCWSRLAASPSARTISCSGSSSSGSRRSSGVLRSSRASPCRSAALQGHGVRPADDHVSSLVACAVHAAGRGPLQERPTRARVWSGDDWRAR